MPLTLSHAWNRLAESRRQFGLLATLHWTMARLAQKLLKLEVCQVVWLEADDLPEELQPDASFEFRFLTAEEVAANAADPVYELDRRFARRVEARRDLCFAALDGDRLASYGWYALGSIEAEHNFGAALSSPPDAAYMYKGFTHPDYRGRRLHGVGMALALSALSERGVRRLVSTVESTNWASLRSCRRLGYRQLGRQWTLRCGSHPWSRGPRAARQRGVRFGRQAVVVAR